VCRCGHEPERIISLPRAKRPEGERAGTLSELEYPCQGGRLTISTRPHCRDTLWHRAPRAAGVCGCRRPATESGTLCHGDGGHEGGDRYRRGQCWLSSRLNAFSGSSRVFSTTCYTRSRYITVTGEQYGSYVRLVGIDWLIDELVPRHHSQTGNTSFCKTPCDPTGLRASRHRATHSLSVEASISIRARGRLPRASVPEDST
jgi:hypothetical protein